MGDQHVFAWSWTVPGVKSHPRNEGAGGGEFRPRVNFGNEAHRDQKTDSLETEEGMAWEERQDNHAWVAEMGMDFAKREIEAGSGALQASMGELQEELQRWRLRLYLPS